MQTTGQNTYKIYDANNEYKSHAHSSMQITITLNPSFEITQAEPYTLQRGDSIFTFAVHNNDNTYWRRGCGQWLLQRRRRVRQNLGFLKARSKRQINDLQERATRQLYFDADSEKDRESRRGRDP